jgi:hypothetical protein
MRTIVDLPQSQIDALAELSVKEGLSRAELIRRAVASFLEGNAPQQEKAFGLWADLSGDDLAEDGLAYQRRIRSEWGQA